MPGSTRGRAVGLSVAARAAIADAEARAAEWFPELDQVSIRVEPDGGMTRPKCALYRLQLADGQRRRSVMVKERLAGQSARLSSRTGSRPTLMPAITASDEEMTRREYEGLRAVGGAARVLAPGCGVARPLALLAEHATLTVEFVDLPTLRQAVMADGRRPAFGRRSVDLRVAMNNAGAWLRVYHGLDPKVELQPRNVDRSEIAALYQAYGDYLGARTGHRPFLSQLTRQSAEGIASWLPQTFDLVVGHGDYVARNMFVAPTGTITVIDPMPRWRVPRHEDLSRFVIGLRLLGVQVVSQGLAIPAGLLDDYEAAFLGGYFGNEPIPRRELYAYQLLILLDKWSAAIGPQPTRPLRRLVAGGRRRWFDRYFRQQASRLLGLLGSAAGAESPRTGREVR